MRAIRAILPAAVAVALLAPGTASAALGWHDAGAGVPDTVTFHDAAALGTGLVAVGKDTVTETDDAGVETTTVVPVVYRLADGAWQRDVVTDTAGLPIAGELAEVAIHGTNVWAVGTRADGTALLVRSAPAPADPALGGPAWEVVEDKRVGTPLSVALSAAGGYVGDHLGQLWPIAGAALGAEPVKTARAARAHGIALADDGSATAVTDGTATEARIFNVTPGAPLAAPAPAFPGGTELLSVARRGTAAIAVDATGYWTRDGETWQRATSELGAGAPQLADVSLGQNVQAMAGRVGADGYVWQRRSESQPWSRAQVAPGAAIAAVVAVASEDLWAVGENGTVMRYFDKPPPPDPPCTENCSDDGDGDGGGGTGGGGDTGGGGGGGTGTGPAPEPTPTASRDATTTVPPQQAGDPTVYVVEPDRPATKRGKKRPKHRRLLDRVKVVRQSRRLLVSFRLRAPARVAVAARRGRAVVSRSRSRVMRPGRRRVVLRFRGKAPTALRIVVRPLPAKKAR